MGIASRKSYKPKGGISARRKERADYRRTAQRINGASRNSMEELKPIVLARDRYTCTACTKSKWEFPNIVLTVDHIVPVAKGGLTILPNLKTLCIDCHISKLGKVNRRGAKMLKGLKKRLANKQ